MNVIFNLHNKTVFIVEAFIREPTFKIRTGFKIIKTALGKNPYLFEFGCFSLDTRRL